MSTSYAEFREAARFMPQDAVRQVLGRKHALIVMIILYITGSARTSHLIRVTGGHPAAVIETLRVLESLRIVRRTRPEKDSRALEARLTILGLQMVETPVHHWERLLQKWRGRALELQLP